MTSRSPKPAGEQAPAKRGPGRPSVGKAYDVRLPDPLHEFALDLSGERGKLAEGIRVALQASTALGADATRWLCDLQQDPEAAQTLRAVRRALTAIRMEDRKTRLKE